MTAWSQIALVMASAISISRRLGTVPVIVIPVTMETVASSSLALLVVMSTALVNRTALARVTSIGTGLLVSSRRSHALVIATLLMVHAIMFLETAHALYLMSYPIVNMLRAIWIVLAMVPAFERMAPALANSIIVALVVR